MVKKKDFDKIYDAYWYQLYGFAYNVLRNKELSEDVVQEIFVDLWSRNDSLQLQQPRAYLFKALRFQCAKKLQHLSLSTIHLDKVAYTLSVLDDEGNISAEERLKLLEKIKNTAKTLLPEKCLHIFFLRYEENLSYREIAEQLHISVNTVDNQLSKALKLLRASNISYDLMLISVYLLYSK